MAKNIKHVWTILCQKVTVDQSTKSTSLVDLLESVTVNMKANDPEKSIPDEKELAKTVKKVPINFKIVSQWYTAGEKHEGDDKVRVVVLDPKEKQLGEFKLNMNAAEGHHFHRTILELNEMLMTTSGIYMFEIQVKGGTDYFTVSSVPLNLNLNIEV